MTSDAPRFYPCFSFTDLIEGALAEGESATDPQILAYHEAGHAVAAAYLGYRLIVVSINPSVAMQEQEGQRIAGCVVARPFRLTRTDNWRQTKVWLAGPVAARRYSGLTIASDGIDILKAWEYAARVTSGPKRQSAYVKRAFEQAWDLLGRKWIEVEYLAAALMAHETLSGLNAMLAMMGEEVAA